MALFSSPPIVRLACTAPALMLLALSSAVHAQAPAAPMSTAEVQLRYERRLAECNVQTLAAPDRQACVRNAGALFDTERAGQPTPPLTTTTDGRATVVRPSNVPAAALPTVDNSTTGVTTLDGRATVIVPAPTPQ